MVLHLCVFFFLFKDFLVYVYECFDSMCMCTTSVPGALEGQMRTLDPLGLDLKTVAGCHVGAGN